MLFHLNLAKNILNFVKPNTEKFFGSFKTPQQKTISFKVFHSSNEMKMKVISVIIKKKKELELDSIQYLLK
jgi:hypothetical protein